MIHARGLQSWDNLTPVRVSLRVITVNTLLWSACGFHPTAASDAPVTTDIGNDSPLPSVFASCNKLHAAEPTRVSGQYTIDPDGDGSDAPLVVWCDMMTDGGGWTVVFSSVDPNMMATPISYTAATPRLLADASSALLAYRDAAMTLLPDDHAALALPAEWRTDAPFNYPGNDVVTDVSINGGLPSMATVRYGSKSFTTTCWDPWIAGSWGRICVVGTQAPFFNAFASTTADGCSDSISVYSASGCSTGRRFSIGVR